MTEDTGSDDLDEETKNLLREVARESSYFDEDEVQFGELLKKMANDYLVVLKLKSRAIAYPEDGKDNATIDDEELSLDPEIKEKQTSLQQEILENI
jgi:hypothetical protein